MLNQILWDDRERFDLDVVAVLQFIEVNLFSIKHTLTTYNETQVELRRIGRISFAVEQLEVRSVR